MQCEKCKWLETMKHCSIKHSPPGVRPCTLVTKRPSFVLICVLFSRLNHAEVPDESLAKITLESGPNHQFPLEKKIHVKNEALLKIPAFQSFIPFIIHNTSYITHAYS